MIATPEVTKLKKVLMLHQKMSVLLRMMSSGYMIDVALMLIKF